MRSVRRRGRRACWWWLLALLTSVLMLANLGCRSDEVRSRTITVRASELRFEPAAITVGRDEVVRLVLRNDGVLDHRLVVEELAAQVQQGQTWVQGEIALRAASQQRIAVVFVASIPGTYDFICTMPGHMEAGMYGTITVE